ncbi:MAG: hypothetical protein IAE99_03725 [Rhodothermales bacterium]|nr:hypothetical protein [Rhodothermales bacterium]MCA0269065.1 hypothetical protein [Bacteroidota bacterium]
MSAPLCLACGSAAVVSLALPLATPLANQTISHTCRLCGDHRVATWSGLGTGCETHESLYPTAFGPLLRQVGQVLAVAEGETMTEWTHFVDDIEVDASYWRQRLDDRRRMLRAKISN